MSSLLQNYDQWKLQTPEQAMCAGRIQRPDTCLNCGADYYDGDREIGECQQCGKYPVCQDCSRPCDWCERTVCDPCGEVITLPYVNHDTGQRFAINWYLCAECKVHALREQEQERKELAS